MGLKHLEDVTYFRLNNEINRPVNGQIMLHKDKEDVYKRQPKTRTSRLATNNRNVLFFIITP